ncbi:response regulator transcription factor [Streptomyces sp. MBT53]|uniref:response regulator transcription factor n=1 Tax=Streptomyces sp. MBT53 TaxID=1488384 RepID=UPI00191185CC|nr:response regulator transcription factor [Streptomyces sp. MBT53]MBK6017459.1 response regulator transcription factor [Streptomyces sp. MBT53]
MTRERSPDRPSVLVVEDDTGISEPLVTALGFLGFDAHTVATGAEALAAVRDHRPDAVLLDLVLPDLDGTEVCRLLRASGDNTPVLFLSGRHSVADKCRALALGGDDYVTKPFDLTELSARIRALIRRSRGTDPLRPLGHDTPAASRRLRAGGVELDVDTREAWRHGQPVRLSATEFALLKVLMENAGRVVSKGSILDSVWKYDFQGESGVVETYVYYLRRKLGDSGQSLIRTVRGAGYLVNADPTTERGSIGGGVGSAGVGGGGVGSGAGGQPIQRS